MNGFLIRSERIVETNQFVDASPLQAFDLHRRGVVPTVIRTKVAQFNRRTIVFSISSGGNFYPYFRAIINSSEWVVTEAYREMSGIDGDGIVRFFAKDPNFGRGQRWRGVASGLLRRRGVWRGRMR